MHRSGILVPELRLNNCFKTNLCVFFMCAWFRMEPKRVLAEVTNKTLENPKEPVKDSQREQTKQ